MTTSAPLPDLDVLTEVFRLTDAVDAARARRPPGPVFIDAGNAMPEPASPETCALYRHLGTLSDDHQSRLHALFWLGHDPWAKARHYAGFYRRALTTGLGEEGADYLCSESRLGECMRYGLEKLGLSQPSSAQAPSASSLSGPES
jgi:hypothetical protein